MKKSASEDETTPYQDLLLGSRNIDMMKAEIRGLTSLLIGLTPGLSLRVPSDSQGKPAFTLSFASGVVTWEIGCMVSKPTETASYISLNCMVKSDKDQEARRVYCNTDGKEICNHLNMDNAHIVHKSLQTLQNVMFELFPGMEKRSLQLVRAAEWYPNTTEESPQE